MGQPQKLAVSYVVRYRVVGFSVWSSPSPTQTSLDVCAADGSLDSSDLGRVASRLLVLAQLEVQVHACQTEWAEKGTCGSRRRNERAALVVVLRYCDHAERGDGSHGRRNAHGYRSNCGARHSALLSPYGVHQGSARLACAKRYIDRAFKCGVGRAASVTSKSPSDWMAHIESACRRSMLYVGGVSKCLLAIHPERRGFIPQSRGPSRLLLRALRGREGTCKSI